MRAAAKILLAALFTAAVFSNARADDDENVIYEAKTPYVEIEIRIQKALDAYPKLYRALKAEGEEFGEECKRDTEESWRMNKSLFSNPYNFSRVYRLRAAAGRYVSAIVDESEFTGGAHPNSTSETLLWDREREERVDFKSLFSDTADNSPAMVALSKLVLDAVFAAKKARDMPADSNDPWFKDWKPEFEIFGSPSLAPSTEAGKSSGVTFHFSPYAVGAYVEGSYTAFVPAAKLAPYLTPEALALFGGERPKSDEDE